MQVDSLEITSNSNVQSNHHRCTICEKNYASYKGLRVHYRNNHPDELGNLIPPTRRVTSYKFKCPYCIRNFNRKAHYNFHMRRRHGIEVEGLVKKLAPCVSCDKEIDTRKYVEHLQLEHDMLIENETYEFSNMQDFYNWKMSVEEESKEIFLRRKFNNYSKNTTTYFNCHRSGFHMSKSKGQRLVKKSSKKINSFCPAKIILTCCKESGKYQVKFTNCHIGHSHDIAHYHKKKKSKPCLPCKENFLEEINIFESSTKSVIVADTLKRRDIPSQININTEKEALKLKVNAMIDVISSEEELQAFKNILSSIETATNTICKRGK